VGSKAKGDRKIFGSRQGEDCRFVGNFFFRKMFKCEGKAGMLRAKTAKKNHLSKLSRMCLKFLILSYGVLSEPSTKARKV